MESACLETVLKSGAGVFVLERLAQYYVKPFAWKSRAKSSPLDASSLSTLHSLVRAHRLST
jgi:hypothetical protein